MGEKDVPPIMVKEAIDPSFLELERKVDKVVKDLFGRNLEKASKALLSEHPKTCGGKDERSSEKTSEHTVKQDGWAL